MPTFRLDDDEVRAIAIHLAIVTGDLKAQKMRAIPEKGKESFEDIAAAWPAIRWAKAAKKRGGTFSRQPEPDWGEGQLELPGSVDPQPAPAYPALTTARSRRKT
ncbi:MAG: hypothetical protein U0Q18_16715 [Bryobacteraceae bacterium]